MYHRHFPIACINHIFGKMASLSDDIILRTEDYRRNCAVISRTHYLASDKLRKRHLQLGIPVLTASTIIGTTIFGTLQSNPEVGWKIFAGIVSIGAALLSGLQTLLNFSERAEKHKCAGAGYSAIRRDLELFQIRFKNTSEDQRNEALTALEKIAEELTKLAQETPNAPDHLWSIAYREEHATGPKLQKPLD